MIWPVVTYAPTAATKPNIAAQPLKRSASGVIFVYVIVNKYNIFIYLCKEIRSLLLNLIKKTLKVLQICVEIYIIGVFWFLLCF